jgi:hypothetical protein
MQAMLEEIFRHPLLLLAILLVVLSFSTWAGVALLKKLKDEAAELQDDVRIIEGATLTLLALIIGFSFSMAVGRYDQRKNLEEAEANAIGTEYVRAELLPADDAARVKALLVKYLGLRIEYYACRADQRPGLDVDTAKLQDQLWASVRGPGLAQPTIMTGLAVSGMNDVLNSQGYTQAAWLNQIPTAAWIMMVVIAIGATVLVGVGAKTAKSSRVLLILPLVLSVALYLIADIDSPRRGMICVTPQNLLILSTQIR